MWIISIKRRDIALHCITIQFDSDCIYDVIFTPHKNTNLNIKKIELITEKNNVLCDLERTDDTFRAFDKTNTLMLILLPYFNKSQLASSGVLQYRITYDGSGDVTYSCKKFFLTYNKSKTIIDKCNHKGIRYGKLFITMEYAKTYHHKDILCKSLKSDKTKLIDFKSINSSI